ncbi:hypothetical protein PISL3812_09232 [Talaromyces islandicus]|uniref:Uncharacterized protein n=1 Tax=Talaromyces islandicus TaxID=28573 RepID=A0A0U1MB59_TALIS|nr:hypothetical protein PISL3812_09232 [Talaromyces islandicus]
MSDSMASILAPISDLPLPTQLHHYVFSSPPLTTYMQNSVLSPPSDRQRQPSQNSGPVQLGNSRCRDSYTLAINTASNCHDPESDDRMLRTGSKPFN